MDYRIGMPELRIVPNRARAADLGISVENVATALNATLGGLRIGKYSTEGRRIDVRLRLLAGQRTRPEDLSRLRLRSNAGDLIPLSSLVTTEEVPLPCRRSRGATESGRSRSTRTWPLECRRPTS